jgi:predicted ATPase
VRARETATEEFEICARYGITDVGSAGGGSADAAARLGWVLVLLGEWPEGLEKLRHAIEENTRQQRKLYMSAYLGRLATGYYTADNLSAASDAIALAFRLANETGERTWDAELRRIEGEIALKLGNIDEAEKAFRAAIGVAQTQEAKSWELRAATSLARLLIQQDRGEEGRALLTPIYDWFTEGFDTADLTDAKALLNDSPGR